MDEAIFPYEIFEIIISHCDLKTLLNCEQVCMDFKILVNKLDKKHNIWEKRILIDIPKDDYLSMKIKLGVPLDEKDRSQILVRNWFLLNSSFRDLQTLTDIQQDDSQARITCAVISGNYFICGTDQGKLLAVDLNGQIKYDWRRYSGKILHLHLFQENYYSDSEFGHKYLFVDFGTHIFLLYLEVGFVLTDTMFRDIVCSSFFENYITFIDTAGYLSVKQIVPNDREISTVHVKSKKFYSPSTVYVLEIWDTLLTYIKNNGQTFQLHYDTQEFNYKEKIWQIVKLDKLGRLWIIHNKVVFYLSGTNIKVFYKHDEEEGKVICDCNTFQVIGGIPTCIFMYAHILFVGTDNGMLLIYLINDWNMFKLNKYTSKVNINGEKINSVDIQELEKSRLICVGHQHGITILAEAIDYELN